MSSIWTLYRPKPTEDAGGIASERNRSPDPGIIMSATAPPVIGTLTIRPSAHLPGQWRVVAAALVLPVFAAVLWFSIPFGTWPRVLAAIAIITAVYAIGQHLFGRVHIVVDHDGLVENGLFARRNRVPSKRIASALLVRVYRGQSLESTTQLFLLDARGELLLRMRGQYWNPDHLSAVANAYGTPIRTIDEPLTVKELRADFGDYLSWFERWPWIAACGVVTLIAGLSLLLIMLLAARPVIGG